MSTESAPTSIVPPSVEVTFAAANTEQGTIRVTSPIKLLNLVPYLLGFHPDNSVVVIGTTGPRSTVHVTQRFPLHQPTTLRLTEFNAEQAAKVLASEECARAFVVGYGPEEHVAPFVRQFRGQADKHGIAVPETLRTEGRRYWSYVCTDPACCPPEGTPYELTPDPELAHLLAVGMPDVFVSRDGLAALVTSVTGTKATAMQRATKRAEARFARLLEQKPSVGNKLAGRALLMCASTIAVKVAMHRFQGDGHLTPTEAAWLTVVLHDVQVRDDLWSRLEAEGRKENLRLLLDLTRLACSGYVAAPATLLAFVAWQSGNGALANVALDRALADDRTTSWRRRSGGPSTLERILGWHGCHSHPSRWPRNIGSALPQTAVRAKAIQTIRGAPSNDRADVYAHASRSSDPVSRSAEFSPVADMRESRSSPSQGTHPRAAATAASSEPYCRSEK
jgi:hypothetical protein